MFYIGIDVGGTFTDIVIFDVASNLTEVIKVPTTPSRPEDATIAALEPYRGRSKEIKLISHATTLATNALLTQTGLAKTALITNAGFRDVLEIGRQRRPEIYNLYTKRPAPLVKRAHRFGVRGRISYDGSELEHLDKKGVTKITERLVREKFESVAVAFLNSYVNPIHELQAGSILRKRFRGFISLSSDVNREYREYERASTTVVNATLSPLISDYLKRLKANLDSWEFRCGLYVMNSDGGVNTFAHASRYPISIIESGPAAGVQASCYLARRLGIERAISFDMGGTTAKVGTILNGEPDLSYEFEAAGRTHSGRSIKGSGYPVRYPFIDLAEVSAGGGSIVWVDEGGTIKVGPNSAGADPGPAAYGKGGLEPTVTDANIISGKINPDHLLGGKMKIYSDLALKALTEKVASKVKMDVRDVADGVLRIANNSMAKAISIVSVKRGKDPRDFSMIAFGGAGPLHTCDLAEEMSIKEIIVPDHPGLFSAFGLLTVDISREFSLPVMSTNLNPDEKLEELRKKAKRQFEEENLLDVSFADFLDVRYKGESYELTLPYERRMDVRRKFEEKHRSRYGYVSDDVVELVNVRIRAISEIKKISLRQDKETSNDKPEPYQERTIRVAKKTVNVPVYNRDRIRPGSSGSGPCIIEEYDSTTVVNPDWSWVVDSLRNLRMAREE
jgi:N-methylhydantoinase A